MITKEKMYMLYEIADDVHWLMLTDVKHIKKVCVPRVVLYAQYKSVMSPMSKQRI